MNSAKINIKPTDIKKVINHNCVGVVWLINAPLTISTKGFYELNYLLDGLLVNSLKAENEKQDYHLFLSQNFGTDFFVAFANIQSCSVDQIYNLINIGLDLVPDNNTVYCLTETGVNLAHILKKYKQYNFKILEMEG